MSIQFSRRHLLAAIPVAGLGITAAQVVANETPITRLFREWKELSARIEDPTISEEECDAACGQRSEVERLMCWMPAASTMDALQKVCAATHFGKLGFEGELWASSWYEAHKMLS